MHDNKLEIEVLNDLIKINNDRIEGYKHAIEETKTMDSDLRRTFEVFIHDSEQYKKNSLGK